MPAATKHFFGALLLVASSAQVSAFAPWPSSGPRPTLSLSIGQDQINENASLDSSVEYQPNPSLSTGQPQTRRDALRNTFSVAIAGTTAVTMGLGEPANAAAVPTAAELEKLRKGHARVQYLLQNWNEITEVCKNNSDQATKQVVRTDGGDKCEKTPLNVQIYMGYKSTEDPLYKADKLMVRAAPLVKDDFDQADYLEAVENYKEKADNTAMMAYTSSWGEANPNGGKDVIDDYLEKTRLDVVSSEKSLRLVLKYLGLEPLPASKNP